MICRFMIVYNDSSLKNDLTQSQFRHELIQCPEITIKETLQQDKAFLIK